MDMILKQLFDRIVSLIALLFLSWLLLVIALAIKIKMKGPVFFVQNRVGKDGVLFKIHKFRTMVVDNNVSKENVTRYATHQGYTVDVTEKDNEYHLSIKK